MPASHKGMMSDATIDRQWPCQVALHAEVCTMEQFPPIQSYACLLGAAPRWCHIEKIGAARLPGHLQPNPTRQ